MYQPWLLSFKETGNMVVIPAQVKKCWRERECCNGGPIRRTETSEGEYNDNFGGPGESTATASRNYIKKSLCEGTHVFQPVCSAIICTRYHSASAFTRATDLPSSRGEITRVMILSASKGANT